MKILLATGIYPPDIGGPATYAKFIYDEFSKRGHKVDVLVYTRVAKGFPKGSSHFVYFLKVLKFGRMADIILTTDTISAGLGVHFAAWFLRKPYVLKIGGDYVWEQGVQRWDVRELLDEFLKKKYGFKIELMRKLQAHVAKSAAKLIAPSCYLASVAEKWGVKRENIIVIYNKTRHPDVLFSREEIRKKLGAKDGEVILFSAGRPVPWKGFEMLKEIEPEIQRHFPTARMVLGTFDKETYDLWLRAADIYLQNTGYEGFPHQILEAMSAGLPIIAAPSGGVPEILTNEKNALLVPYNDKNAWISAILRLLKDPELRVRLVQAARSRAQEFLNKDIVGATLEVLEEVI